MAMGGMIRKLPGVAMLALLASAMFSQSAQAACTYGACAPSNANIGSTVVRSASSQAAGLLSDRISQVVGGGTLFNVSPSTPAPSVPMPSVPTPSAPSSGDKVGPQTNLEPTDGANVADATVANSAGIGSSAGDMPQNLGIWASGTNHWVHDTQAGTAFSGGIYDVIGGADYKLDKLLLGVGAGYEHVAVGTSFNHGHLTGNGFGLSPYLGYEINDIVSADMQLSHVWVGYSENHAGITGSNSGSRWSVSSNLNANSVMGQNWLVGSSLGLFYVREFQDAFRESNGNQVGSTAPFTGEVRLKGTVGYRLQYGDIELVPNISARLEYDPLQSGAPIIDSNGTEAAHDKLGATFGAGLRGRLGEGTTLSLDGTTSQFRSYMTDYGLSLTLRIQY